MPQADPIDFWFSIGSLYTYLAVMRLPNVEARSGVAFRWRPFSIRTIMIEMDNIPAKKPVKMAYSWRDLERRAEQHGHPFRTRPPYPLKNFDLTNRIAVVGAQEGWCADYVRAAYKSWFLEHKEAGGDENNHASLRAAGQDPDRVLSRAASNEVTKAYDAATSEARKLGIFGVPTFVTGGELFWGDDRLDDAVQWYCARR
jgi:2-hydroxychromene-2-carboxylate isomerase